MTPELKRRLIHWMRNVYPLVKSNHLEQGTVFDNWLHDEMCEIFEAIDDQQRSAGGEDSAGSD